MTVEKYIRRYNVGKQQMEQGERDHSVLCLNLDSSGDWLLVGTSANYASIWNLSLMEFTNCIPIAGIPKKLIFNGTNILSIGSEEFIYHWNIVGKFKVRVSTSSTALSDIQVNESDIESHRVLIVCGNSDKIDIFSNFTHKGFSFISPHPQ